MKTEEILEVLSKMNALTTVEGKQQVISSKLMVDPIVCNKLAVELLQQVDRKSKPEIILSQPGVDSYFAYNVALSAWMKFGFCEEAEGKLKPSLSVRKKDRVIVVMDNFDKDLAQRFVDYLVSIEAKPVAVLSVVGSDDVLEGVPCLSLVKNSSC